MSFAPLSVGLLAVVYTIKFLFPETPKPPALYAEDYQAPFSPSSLPLISRACSWAGFMAGLFGYSRRASMTIGIEMGIQNPGLVIFIGSVLLQQDALLKPALLYALFSFWTTELIRLPGEVATCIKW
jgi:BASS family bile acid:Na+ symporter